MANKFLVTAVIAVAAMSVIPSAQPMDVSGASAAQTAVTATNLLDYLQNQLVTMDLKNADLDNVLRIIATQYNINIVAGEAVAGKVTVSFKDATLAGALKSVLTSNGYGYIVEGNIIRVAKAETITEEQKRVQEGVQLEALVTEVYFLKYLDANDVKKILDPLLTPRGKITVVLRKGYKGFQFGQITSLAGTGKTGTEAATGGTLGGATTGYGATGVGTSPSAGTGIVKSGEGGEKSTILVIQDISSSIALIKTILKEIDVRPRQILIQSRMFEINADDLRDLGIDFATGVTGLESTGTPPVTSVPWDKRDFGPPPTLNQSIRTIKQGGGIVRLDKFSGSSDYVFGRDGQDGMQLRMQKVTGAQFDAMIKAIESNVDYNELSGPRIMVLENQEAAILVGQMYPIFQTTAPNIAQSSTVESLSYFQPIGISLQVIPQVVGEDKINMVIHPSVSTLAGTVKGSTGLTAPLISIREADTQVMIGHKETLVIGGLLEDKDKEVVVGIPFVMDMPILGNFFKRKKTAVSKIELVIFITPTIVTEVEFTDRDKVVYDKAKAKEAIASTNPWDIIGRKLTEQFLK